MTSTVVYIENILVATGRVVIESEGRSLNELAPNWQIPYVAFVDGEPVMRADWELVPDGMNVAFVEVGAIPQGGGGGGSDPMRTVLMLSVIYFTGGLGGAMLGIEGAAAVGAMGVAAANAAVTMVGMALVNAILPAPKLPSNQQSAASSAASPTYSIGAQGNTARVDGAIPEHFGRLKVYPDFAAQPYTEFHGNEQYLYTLLCVGRGSYNIEGIYIEDSPDY